MRTGLGAALVVTTLGCTGGPQPTRPRPAPPRYVQTTRPPPFTIEATGPYEGPLPRLQRAVGFQAPLGAPAAAAALAPDGGALVELDGHGVTIRADGRGAPRSIPLGELVAAMAWDGQRVVAIDPRGAWLLRDEGPAGAWRRWQLVGAPASPTSAAIAADGVRVAVGGRDGRVAVWELGAGAPAACSAWLDGERKRPVTALALVGPGTLLAGHADGSVVRWLLDPVAPGAPPTWGRPALLGRDRAAARILRAGPDGLVLSGGDSGVVTLRRADELVASFVVEGHDPLDGFVDLALSPDGREVLAASPDGVVRGLELPSGRERWRIDLRPADDEPIRVAALDGGALVLVTRRGLFVRFERR